MKDVSNILKFSTKFIFAQESLEEETFHQNDLVQLFPYGLSVDGDVTRPFLLLKDEGHHHTLPVAVSPIDAGVTLSQSDKMNVPSSPHAFTSTLLQSLGIEIKQAVFVEIKGSSQYLRLYLSGHPKMSSVKMRADEAMSLCMFLEVPLFATKKFISLSRVMSTEVESGAQKLNNLGIFDKGSGYLN
jgi:bifunctional DNase/RNase